MEQGPDGAILLDAENIVLPLRQSSTPFGIEFPGQRVPAGTGQTRLRNGGHRKQDHRGQEPYDHGSQLAKAEAFLPAHRGSTVLVTIDIGANDLSRCINRATGVIDMTCVSTAFQQAPANLGIYP
jgi:hypothetical protein